MFIFALVLFCVEWVETTREDFIDGWFECNLYVSHRGDGSVEFGPRWDANNDGYIDLITSDDELSSGSIYWGYNAGYSDSRSSLYLGAGGGAGCFADLDIDGYSEFITTGPVQIYWGSAEGPDNLNSTELGEGDESCFIADFDKDGFLDIAFDDLRGYGGVYWGGTEGYTEENSTYLTTEGAQHNVEAADLDKDGWLDLVFVNDEADFNTIFWGSEQGFSLDDTTNLPYISFRPHGCSVADLDGDGWLDLVFTGYLSILESWIYWGPEFEESQKRVLNLDNCFGGSSVSDIDSDSLLDIVFFCGSPQDSFSIFHATIIEGDAARFSTNTTRQIGPELRSSGGFVADFNEDGDVDIFLNGYDGKSYVLYGPEFGTSDGITLQANDGHHGCAREVGDVYTREYKEYYYSSIFDAGRIASWTEVFWEDSCPGNSQINLEVRIGSTPDTSDWEPWIEVENGQEITQMLESQYIQYRASFEYSNPAELPFLFLVGVEYEINGIIVKPDQDLEAYPEDYVTCELSVLNYTPDLDIVEISYEAGESGFSYEITDSLGRPLGDLDSDNSPDLGYIFPNGGQNKLLVHVEVPPDVQPGTVDTLIVFGHSSNDDSLFDSAIVVTTVLEEGDLIIQPDRTGSVPTGQASLRYTLEVINQSHKDEFGEITFTNHLGWQVTLYDSTGEEILQDNNTNGIQDVGELEAFGGQSTLYVEVGRPSEFDPVLGSLDTSLSQLGLVETTWVYVTPASGEEPDDSALILTTLIPGLTLHNYPNPFETESHIVWSQPVDGEISIRLADRAGRQVTDVYEATCEAGIHSYLWRAQTSEGTALAPGVYVLLLDLKTQDGTKSRKIEKVLCTGSQ